MVHDHKMEGILHVEQPMLRAIIIRIQEPRIHGEGGLERRSGEIRLTDFE